MRDVRLRTARPVRVGGDVVRDLLVVPGVVLPVALLATVRGGLGTAALVTLVTLAVVTCAALVVRGRRLARRAGHARSHDALTPVAVVVVDIDNHRQIVRSWGRATGDRVVTLAGRRLVEHLPPGALVARLGGDVFAAVVRRPGTDLVLQAEGLRRALELPLDLGARPALPSPRGVRHRGAGLRLRTTARRRADIEAALRHAVEREELFLVYQPVVDLPHGRVIGAEALLRWSNPALGDVQPGEFVPVAEESGIIEALGTWVIEEACRRLVLWDATGLLPLELTMAINVSTRQLRSDRLAVLLRDVLETTRLEPGRIVLEITESAMPDDTETFVEVLTGLRRLGVHLSLDDFGTGYSSLSYLRRLPVTSVKLDRSLVEHVARPPGDAIARAVQGIATALGIVVIAEGVEHEAQRDALRAMGVAQGQGWLWGRAVRPKDFLAPIVAAAALGPPRRTEPLVGPPVRPPVEPLVPQPRSTTTGA